jgi:thiol-disulfide isomerase/thioredoxin
VSTDKIHPIAALRQRKWFGWFVLLLFTGTVLVGWRLWPSLGLATGEAPSLVGTMVDGAEFDLKREAGKATLVYFWGSWCPDCLAYQSTIDSLNQDHAVITVALTSGADLEVQQYLAKHNLFWRALNDPQGTLAKSWSVRGVPVMFIVDGQGRIRFRLQGSRGGNGLRMRLWVAEHF